MYWVRFNFQEKIGKFGKSITDLAQMCTRDSQNKICVKKNVGNIPLERRFCIRFHISRITFGKENGKSDCKAR